MLIAVGDPNELGVGTEIDTLPGRTRDEHGEVASDYLQSVLVSRTALVRVDEITV
jgi:hypothetical protein